MTFREHKRAARQRLHDRMKVAAAYYAPGSSTGTPVDVRVHTNFESLGSLGSESRGYADRQEPTPRLVIPAALIPRRGGRVVVDSTEGYIIESLEPVDGDFQVAMVTRLAADELAEILT